VWIGWLSLVPKREEEVAGEEVDDQVAWVWIGYLRLVPRLEEQGAGEEVD
jgi:hypothetical protein